jgi:hypothetical protein
MIYYVLFKFSHSLLYWPVSPYIQRITSAFFILFSYSILLSQREMSAGDPEIFDLMTILRVR